MAEPQYNAIPKAPQSWERIWAERLVYAVNLLIAKANCTLDLTLDPLATVTTLTDFRIHPGCVLGFMPVTANAATAKPSIYVTNVGKGSADINHASAAAVDQTFRVSIVG